MFETSIYLILLCVASTLVMLLFFRGTASNEFKDQSGFKMRQVQGDTRVRRFSHGREISDQGHELGGGNPYIIVNGSRKEVVLCKPEHLRDFFSGDARDHWKAPDGNMGYFFHRLLGDCVGAHSGETWKSIRFLFNPLYTPSAMLEFRHYFIGELRDWLSSMCMQRTFQTLDEKSFRVDVSERCGSLLLKLVASTLYGDALTSGHFSDLMELAQIREELGANAFLRSHLISKFYALLPTKANRDLSRYVQGFRELNLRMVRDAEQCDSKCPLMHVVRDINATGRVSMQQVLHTVDEILFENLDVASSALSCLLLNVASNATVQDALRDEIKQMEKQKIGKDSYLARSDTYLELCCAESRRLCPAIWFTFCERSPSDKLIGGFFVPANTDVTTDWKRVSIDSPVWTFRSDDGREINGYDFYPNRYHHLSKSDLRHSLVGYGAGARQCIGQHFASLVMRMVLFEIISQYHLSTEAPPWDIGFRRDKFVLTPKSCELVFRAI